MKREREDVYPPSIWERFPELGEIPRNKFPNHLLIIPDGNQRWADRQSPQQPTIFGHENGAKVLKGVLRDLRELPIRIVTVWGLSADNIQKRSVEEVKGITSVIASTIDEILPELLQNKTRLIHLGRKDRIPDTLRLTIENAEERTKDCGDKIFCVAIDFGGEDQTMRMIKKVLEMAKEGKIEDKDITDKFVESLRDGGGRIPPADVVIRTSGELRGSDLGWLGVNSEYCPIQELLPDTTTKDFVDALFEFSKRERRFGGRPTEHTTR